MNLGRAIRIIRETNEVSLSSLAKEAELSISMLSMIEKGQREPSLGTLRRLANGLSVPLDVLIAVTQPGEGTLASSDDRARALASVLEKLERLEQEIRLLSGKNVYEPVSEAYPAPHCGHNGGV